MPRNTNSKQSQQARLQKAADRDEREARLQEALAGLAAGMYPSASAAASAHNVPRQTLVDRSRGMTPKRDAHQQQQALSRAAEDALVEHLRRSSANGFPLDHGSLYSFAQTLARAANPNAEVPKLGHEWLAGFLVRNPSVRTCWSRCLENARVRATDAATIREWFTRLANVVQEFGIPSTSIFNMDETGYMLGQGAKQRVFVPDGDLKARFKAQPGNRDSATVIECIGSGGQVLPPLIITRGKIHTVGEQRRMVDVPSTWHFSKQLAGWTDNELAVLWVDNIFEPNTRPSSPSAWRLLIIDGHKSHTSPEFLDRLWKRRIVPLCLPAHCTHVMQPLDVSIFGPLKAAYRRLVTELAPHSPAAGIDKSQFGSLLAQARATTLTSAAAKKAFVDSGYVECPGPTKVLRRLPGSADAGRQSSAPESKAPAAAPATPTIPTLDDLLAAYKDATDPRNARVLKRQLHDAFDQPRADIERLEAENTVLRAQQAHDTEVSKRARPRTQVGDRMILTRDRMISREHAERELVAKGPQIREHQERLHHRDARRAAANDDEAANNDDEDPLASPTPPPPPPPHSPGEVDARAPLSAIENIVPAQTNFYDSVPHASSSRTRL